MTQSFAATIGDWVEQTENAAEMIFKESSQRMLAGAQTPVEAGGSMPVDTGFLRGSLTVGINSEPADVTTVRSGDAYVLEIAPAEWGDTLLARWTAAYAAPVEYGAKGRAGRGFARQAAQRWVEIVRQVEAEAKALVGLG